ARSKKSTVGAPFLFVQWHHRPHSCGGVDQAANHIFLGQNGVEIARQKWRLLIVEDESLQATLMADVLEEAGYEVIGPVRNLREAMQIVQLDHFDGALLDVQLEGELSLPLASILTRRGVPVLFVSGQPNPFQAKDWSRVDYLAKPYGENELLARVAAMFASSPSSPSPQAA
ncbi:MAG: response regulator, partial [Alphaproteobacteria bacterium]